MAWRAWAPTAWAAKVSMRWDRCGCLARSIQSPNSAHSAQTSCHVPEVVTVFGLLSCQLLHPQRHHPHTASPTNLPPPLHPNPQPPRYLRCINPLAQKFLPAGIEVPPGRGALIRTLLFHRKSHAASRACSCVGNTNQQNGDLPRLPPLLYQVPAGTGPGHPHHPGATRPQGWKHHHDLRACA